VDARGLTKVYGRQRALAGVDLTLRAGEATALLGPNGAGKSTLLHLLGGLDDADEGTLEVAGRRLDGLDERGRTDLRRRAIGFVFQSFHLLPELSGLENVLLPARLPRTGGGATARARALIDELGLADTAARLPATLSGGEQQRLAVARALVNEPVLILADEPTGNLDEESGAAVLQLLRSLADQGRAVVLVTHDRKAGGIADRTITLRAGRLQP